MRYLVQIPATGFPHSARDFTLVISGDVNSGLWETEPKTRVATTSSRPQGNIR